MHIVLCLDDRNGMLFNHRRLSSDQAVCEKVLKDAAGNVWMNAYSAKLFADREVCVDDDFLDKAATEDTCFVEDLAFLSRQEQIQSITVYRWNRHYPSDVKCPADLFANWTLTEKIDFPGNSHEIITQEKYAR